MFSKRRSGLFKKASVLCTLCGVEIAIIVFSPFNKAFSFGHREVDTIIDRFLTRRPKPVEYASASQILEAHRNNNIHDLNFVEVEFDRKNREEIDQMRRANETKAWWESSLKGLRLGELEQLKMAMDEVMKDVVEHSNKLANNVILIACDQKDGRPHG